MSQRIINKYPLPYKCIVKKIHTGIKEDNAYKYAVINGLAHCQIQEPTEISGTKQLKQDITIFAQGGLVDYIESEVSEGDKLLVLGQIFTKQRRRGTYYYYEQCIFAEEIYKNEWQKYY